MSTSTPPPKPGLFVYLWRALFGEPKIGEIWKTEREEYLRRERRVSDDLYTMYDCYDVYALHQISLTTGNKRIVEAWKLT